MSMDWDAERQAQHERAFEGVQEPPPWALTFMALWARPTRPTIDHVLAHWPDNGPAAPTREDAIAFRDHLLAANRAARRAAS